MFAYCNNNSVGTTDPHGHLPKWITDSAEWVNNNIFKPIGNFAKKQYNNVREAHFTQQLMQLDFGLLLGKVGISTTYTERNESRKPFFSYSNIGNDCCSWGAGINLGGWLGLDLGVNSNGNVYLNLQVTPLLHGNISLGYEGIGASIGVDHKQTSYDLSATAGWGTVIALLLPEAAPGLIPALKYAN